MNGRGKIKVKFFEYSVSRKYSIQPDIVEYDRHTMTKPKFDLILVINTLKELEFVLDFWTKTIILNFTANERHQKAF